MGQENLKKRIADKKNDMAKRMSYSQIRTDELNRNVRPFLVEENFKDEKNINHTISVHRNEVVNLWFALSGFETIPRLLIDKKDELDVQSVSQVVLFPEASNNLKMAYINGLAAHYSVANSLLRHFMESVTMAALCEYLSHDKYRRRAKYLPRNLLNKINRLSGKRKRTIERQSSLVLPEIWGFFEKKKDLHVLNTLQALRHWRNLRPYTDRQIYGLYGYLSKFTHQSPARTDAVQSIINSDLGKPFYETGYNSAGFNEFSKNMFNVLDVGMVISLSTLMSFLVNNWQTEAVLRDQHKIITRNKLPLPNTIKKLELLTPNS